jgi:hypothetical protein
LSHPEYYELREELIGFLEAQGTREGSWPATERASSEEAVA